jgi:PAS domain S-box-containing protein
MKTPLRGNEVPPPEARSGSGLVTDDQFRSLFEHSSDAVLLSTPDGNVLAANPEACRVFGRSEAEICAIGRAGLIDPTDPRLPRLLEERDRTGLFKGELRFKRKDGSSFPADVSSVFYRDRGGTMRASTVIRDVTERQRTEQRNAAQHDVTSALADCASLADAAPRILRALCDNLDWDIGALWQVDRPAHVLRCTETVRREGVGAEAFAAAAGGRTLDHGVGLPGRAWASGEPLWLADGAGEAGFPRAPVAAGARLHAEAAFPIRLGAEVLGVIELFSQEVRPPDSALFDTMAGIGAQVGQFIERKRTEALIQTTAAAVASATGADFFPALVRHLATVLEARHAFVTECVDAAGTHVRMRAWWKEDGLAEAVEYDVAGTPCEAVLRGEACWFPDRLQQRFHADRDLAVLKAESYLGIPLLGAAGEVIGHLVVIDDKPMRTDPRGLPVLRIFAARAAAELSRLASERRTQQSNRFLQEIIDGAEEGIIVYDSALRYVVFNRFMERLHGVPAADLLGKPATEVFPWVRESGIDVMVQRALRGEAVQARELLLRRPGREDVWEFYRVGPHYDAQGHIVGAIALVSDITERHRAEEALRAASTEIAALNTQLEAENVYLRRDLIANVSHDLRTPLAALHGYLETLIVKGDELAPETRRGYLETAARQSAHLGTLIAELFELVKLDFKGFEIHPEPAQLGDLAQDVLQKFQLDADKKGVALRAEIALHLPLVEADISLIERVLDNLIGNALRHTPPGGSVTLAVTAHDGAVRIRVADSGGGIPPAELPHIFERFYRVDRSRSRGTGGAGLGLAIVKRIVELHGAQIEAQSAPDKGAAFSFALPAVVR